MSQSCSSFFFFFFVEINFQKVNKSCRENLKDGAAEIGVQGHRGEGTKPENSSGGAYLSKALLYFSTVSQFTVRVGLGLLSGCF